MMNRVNILKRVELDPDKTEHAYLKNKREGAKSWCLFGTTFYYRGRPPTDNGIQAPLALDNPILASDPTLTLHKNV